MKLRLIIFTSLALFLFSCSKDKAVYKPTIKIDPYVIYQEGLDSFKKNQFFFASKKFAEAEINFTSGISKILPNEKGGKVIGTFSKNKWF